MPTARVNGVRLYDEDAGSGPPLLFIHAFPVGCRIWEPQLQVFARRYRVIAYDCCGFGRSEAPRDPAAYSQAFSVEDAFALLRHLDALPAALCGLSMGGNIALHLALAHPEAVTALVACDTGSGSEAPEAFRARCEEFAAAAGQGIEAFCQTALGRSLLADFARRGPDEAALLRELIFEQPPHGVALTARHTLATRQPIYTPEARLATLGVPTLVVYDEHDAACIETSRFMAETIPGARLFFVPGVSHFVNLDEPELFNATVLEFLDQALGVCNTS